MAEGLKARGPEMVKKVNAIIAFKIEGVTYTVDLKNGEGGVEEGDGKKPDLSITLSDDNFIQLIQGKLNPQMAFMSGKLKIGGNMALAMKLGPILKEIGSAVPKPKL